MNEESLKHGAIPLNRFHRKARKVLRKIEGQTLGKASVPFDWNTGYDVRDTIGSIAIKDQGLSDSCGGQAGAYFIEIQRRLQNVKEGAISAKSIYAPIAYKGGGTTITALETQIGAHGAELETTVPSYDANGNPLSEAMITEKSWLTDSVSKDMLTRAGYAPWDIADDIETIAQTIKQYGAVLWEITGENNGTWRSAYPKPPQNDSWHHFMCAIGAKVINGKKYIIALQEWGTGTGDNGIQYFGEEYFASDWIDAFAFIPDSEIVPAPQNMSIWAEIIRWFRKQWSLAHYLAVS